MRIEFPKRMNHEPAEKVIKAVNRALQKQEPKTPTLSGTYYVCPNCERLLRKYENPYRDLVIPYCKWCGQRLDWEE